MLLKRACVAALLLVLGLSGNARAQFKGHYLPGFTGLNNGTQPPPSISVGLPFYFFPTDTLKDANGRTIPVDASLKTAFFGPLLSVVTNAKVLGANYGFSAIPATWFRARIEANALDAPGSFQFSDTLFVPVSLGWEKTRANILAQWMFFAPTGKWELGGTDNSGLGMWSHDFQLGTTVHLDDTRTWTTSVLGTYEINTRKEDSDIEVGDTLTIEGGTGRAFMKKVSGAALPRIINAGVVYYAQFKVTADEVHDPIIDDVLADSQDRVFAVGGEVNVFLPKSKLLLGARVLPEFGAHTRPQGVTFMFTVGYEAKSLARRP